MTDPRITKEMIEAGARKFQTKPAWETLSEGLRDGWRALALEVLEAVFALLPEPEYEYRCTNPAIVTPCAPGHRCEGGRVDRRTKAGPWHPVPDTNEGETQ